MNTLKHQVIILLRGGLGSGKTTVGRLIRDGLPQAVSISFNILHLFLSQNPTKNKALTFEVALVLTEFFLQKGFSVILDELFVFPETLQPFFNLGKKHQTPVFLFQLEVSEEEAFRRYNSQGVKGVRKEGIQRIQRLLASYPIPQAQKINTELFSPQQIRDQILHHIDKKLSQK